MSENNPVRLFVTHTFAENADYHRVFEYLESAPNFFYVNCSKPDEMPGSGGKEAVKEALRDQISTAEAVIVLSSLYRDNHNWMKYEMDVAQAHELPLIALEPFGGVDPMPDEVASRAAEVVPWNERILIDALLRQARHEQTNRWEVIEFDL